jgi:hypothetical protein
LNSKVQFGAITQEPTMNTKANEQQEKDDNKYNRKYAVAIMAQEIARRHTELLQSECVAEAERLYGRGERPTIESMR